MDDGGATAGLLHPFEVFPEELWPEIIEKLQDSTEILKVTQAIPEIKDIMESRKRWWLFDQVIPHVSHWLEEADVLSCRRVCQQWSHGVDNLLENHPRNRAYNPEQPVTGQVWVHEMMPSSSNAWNYLHPMLFNRQDKLTRFLQDMMKSHPKDRSPIVGRAVQLNTQKDIGVLTGASELFRSFIGPHIWHLELEDYASTDPIPFSNSIREWIDLLPNLKGLQLQISPRNDRSDVLDGFLNVRYMDDDAEFFARSNMAQLEPVEAKEICQESTSEKETAAAPDPWMEPLPPLPHLDTLQIHWDTLPPSMVNALMSSYSLQIRRLRFPLRYWKPKYFTMFPNLTGLTIDYIFSKPRLIHILLSLRAPLLYDLTLWLEDIIQMDVETDILPWLKRFTHIRNLSLFSGPPLSGTDVVLNPELDSVPSLKYLSVPEIFLHANSDLLLCFPNLEYLALGDSTHPDPDAAAVEPTLKIWESIVDQTVYESNVWELLPNLKVITLTDPDTDDDDDDWYDPGIRFTRETYEHQKKFPEPAEPS